MAQGRALAQAGRHAEVLTLIEEARENPDGPVVDGEVLESNYAWALLHVGRVAEALEVTTALLAILDDVDATATPRTVNVHGMVLAAAGEPEAALEVLTDAIVDAILAENDAWVASAHFLARGDALAALDRFDEARAAWSAARDLDEAGIFGHDAIERLRTRTSSGPYRTGR